LFVLNRTIEQGSTGISYLIIVYLRFSLFSYATHPSPEDGGLNSGLMLMNLEGLRKSLWTKAILTINEELAPFNVFGDQVEAEKWLWFLFNKCF